MNDFFDRVAGATHRDPRIAFWREDVGDMADVYALADCFAIPSRAEGWGMPHREAAMMGLPVITMRHSGLDDGHTDKWALVVEGGRVEEVPFQEREHLAGEWFRADVDELAAKMRWCYEHPAEAAVFGQSAAAWLRANQTWKHTAGQLLELVERYG
jgi:glycosyltransferase involved in cell wall biosynthesis